MAYVHTIWYKKLKDIAKQSGVTGTVVDVCGLESTGGGYYPAFRVENGEVLELLSTDIGDDLIRSLVESETERTINLSFLESLNIWTFYFCDDWTLEKLGTRQKERFLLNKLAT